MLERERLGNGLTGRAAGLLGQLRGMAEHTRMLMDGVEIVRELERRADVVIFVQTGWLCVAATDEGAGEIRDLAAMGADRALHVECDEALDPWNVACVLQAIVRREQPDPVLLVGTTLIAIEYVLADLVGEASIIHAARWLSRPRRHGRSERHRRIARRIAVRERSLAQIAPDLVVYRAKYVAAYSHAGSARSMCPRLGSINVFVSRQICLYSDTADTG